MKLSEHLLAGQNYNERMRDNAHLRFELFDWLKRKELTVQEAVDLLFVTRSEIVEEYNRSIEKMYL